MNDARHERLRELFVEARRLAPDARRALLDQASRDDAALGRELEQLLAWDERAVPGVDAVPGAAAAPGAEILARALGEPTDSPGDDGAPAEIPARIGHYSIRGVIGEGGMGVVYEARQEDPARSVALKVIRPGLVSRGLLRRFRHEAQVLGQLQHPGIAQIYEAGTADSGEGGVPFFAMELVHGRPLLEYAEAHALGTRARLELIARVCDALHHAHQKGVVHRDLKPANILVEELGQPKVLDFGVARATDVDVQTISLQTDVGQLVGTVPYMSPEQASGDPALIDLRSDVYSLGVITFELLTGRLPYAVQGKMIHEAVRIIQDQEPSRLSSMNRALRGDVETIVGKALEKLPQRRYPSAADLAADIRRYLADQPIVARPASALYQFRKFARRNKALVAGVGVAFAALLVATAVSLWQARVAVLAGEARARQAYRATIAAADTAITADDPIAARERLDSVAPEDRGWEWNHLSARLDESIALVALDTPIACTGLSADGTRVLTIGTDGTLETVPIRGNDHRTPPVALPITSATQAAFSADASHVAVVYGPDHVNIGLWSISGTAPTLAATATAGAAVAQLDMTPDGRVIAARLPDRIWTWEPLADRSTTIAAGLGFRRISLSADGRRLAFTRAHDGNQHIAVYDIETGKALYTSYAERDGSTVALCPDGSVLATGGFDKKVRLRRVADGQLIAELAAHTGVPFVLAFSPDGNLLVSGSVDQTLRLWDARSGRALAVLTGHAAPLGSLRFSGDGSRIASMAADGLRLWDVALRDDVTVLRGHSRYVYSVAFSPDGRRLYSGSWDKTARAWDAASGECLAVLHDCEEVKAIAVSPDGRRLVTGHGGSFGMPARDTDTGSIAGVPVRQHGVQAIAFGPSGDRAVLATPGATVVIWDIASNARVTELKGHSQSVRSVAWTGTLIAAGSEDKTARLWDARTGALLHTLAGHEGPLFAVALNHDGSRLATGATDKTVRLWDTASGRLLTVLRGHGGTVYAIAFSPDGSRLGSGSDDTTIRLWDVADGELLLQLRGHEEYIYGLAFSPDGSMLASASGDGTVRLWDTRPARTRWGDRARMQQMRAQAGAAVENAFDELHDWAPVAARLRADPRLGAEEREAALQLVLQRAAAPLPEHPNGTVVEEFERDAGAWLAASPGAETYAWDQFFPGQVARVAIIDPPDQLVTVRLAGGTLTLHGLGPGGRTFPPIGDGSSAAVVSDAAITGLASRLIIDFDPPITAFYTLYGSLALNATVTMHLHSDGALVDRIDSAPSPHSVRATGHGFRSPVPVDRIDLTCTGDSAVLVGAFTGLQPGEPSLGTIEIPGYEGPTGATVQLDFACVFSKRGP